MDRLAFEKALRSLLQLLFDQCRKQDELSFVFTLLGINSGMEDAGWQPISETEKFVRDLTSLANAPLDEDTKIRLYLLVYCHVTEASYFYHLFYNLLLSIEGNPPHVFNFIDLYRKGVPPSTAAKVTAIREKAESLGIGQIKTVFDALLRSDIRNAFFHSDYILHDGKLRLKHKGGEFREIAVEEVTQLTQRAIDFFEIITEELVKARRSFPPGYRIENRKSPSGHPRSSIDLIFDERGMLSGFSSSDPLPLW